MKTTNQTTPSIYPFGMIMSERSFSSEKYRYGFNSQEKDDEVAGSGNINTAEYWEYDCRLGRRWNLDPKSNVSLSDYSCLGNNPLYFIDKQGDKFTDPKDKDEAMRLKQEFSKQEATYNSLADKAQRFSKLAYKIHFNNLGDQFRLKRDRYRTAAFEMKQAQTEIDYLLTCEQKYTFEQSGGKLSRLEGDVYVISVTGDDGNYSHELKHAYDFSHNKAVSNPSNPNNFLYVDIYDEQAAYLRQFYFRPSSLPNSYAGNISDKEMETANASRISAEWVRNIYSVVDDQKIQSYLKVPMFRWDATGAYSEENSIYYDNVIKPWKLINEPQVFKQIEFDKEGRININRR